MPSESELMPARVRVPASTSNLGSGFDCVGLAVARRLEAAFEPGGAAFRVERSGTLAGLREREEDDVLVRAFRARLALRGFVRPRGRLRAWSEIPVGRGLGSSAAAVVAGLALADAVAGVVAGEPDAAPVAAPEPVAGAAASGAMVAGARSAGRSAAAEPGPPSASLLDDWFLHASEQEGHPDNAAPAVFGGLVAALRDEAGRPRVVPLPLSPAVGFAFAAPGAAISTAAARRALPAAVPHAVAARALGRLAALLRGLALGDAELLRVGFADELHVPYRLALIPGAGAAVEAAREAGAWAVTVSGSGSGLLAACPPARAAEVAAAMGEAFRRAAGPDGVVHFEARPAAEGVRVEVRP